MNERIRELAEQAGEYANESTKDFTGDEPVVWMDYYTEKFADLLIKKVFAKIEDERFEVYQPVKESVMKHFGVQ